MSIPYFDKEIKDHERINGPFIGYISPNGKLINYSRLLGPRGHDNWRNPATLIFLKYISFVLTGSNIESYKNSSIENIKRMYERNKYKGSLDIKDAVIRGYEPSSPHFTFLNLTDYKSFLNELNSHFQNGVGKTSFHDEYDMISHDLVEFFAQCYSKGDFFNSLGRVIKVPSKSDIEKNFEEWLETLDYDQRGKFISDYYTYSLMSSFKDIMVCYLGYDSIERARPMSIENMIFYNHMYEESNGFEYLPQPSILTSCITPNKRYFNWILNGWKIIRAPRMILNTNSGIWEESPISFFHQSYEEEELAREAAKIRAKTPKDELYKYYIR